MRIVEADLHLVRLPLVHAFQTSSHRKGHLDHILLRLRDESGTEGWGEIASPSDPFYCAETVDTAWLMLRRYFLPAVLGAQWDTPAEAARLWRKVRGNHFAAAGVDMAVWSLWSAAQNLPLARALGGTRSEVSAGVSLGIEPTIDDLLDQVGRQAEAGYQRVKLKIAPGWDREPVHAVRATFPNVALHVDANGAYGTSAAEMDCLAALDDCGLSMIEQPFAPRDFLAHAALQRRIDTPVCLDESIETVEDLQTALALDAVRVLNIKVSRMGGLTPAVTAHDVATAAGVPVWCGGMHEFGVGRAANIALSSLPGFSLPSDVSASAKYYARDIVSPAATAEDGMVTVPAAAGLGTSVDFGFLQANALRSESFAADRL